MFLLELPGGIEAGLEVGVDCGRALVFLVLRQPSGLFTLKTGHCSVEFLIHSQKFSLGFVVNVDILGVDLHYQRGTLGNF